jgi:hypothetical protein
MPSKSAAQAKLMNIAAHTPGGYGGVPQKVGEEFHEADKAEGKFKGKKKSRRQSKMDKMYKD